MLTLHACIEFASLWLKSHRKIKFAVLNDSAIDNSGLIYFFETYILCVVGDDEQPEKVVAPPPRVEDPIWNETRCVRVFGNEYNLPEDKEEFLKYIQ